MSFTYDDLYGIDLEQYCKCHNTTIDKLIEKVIIDINILKNRLNELVWNRPNSKENQLLINEIHKLIDKKENHLKRLIKWKKN